MHARERKGDQVRERVGSRKAERYGKKMPGEIHNYEWFIFVVIGSLATTDFNLKLGSHTIHLWCCCFCILVLGYSCAGPLSVRYVWTGTDTNCRGG